VDAVVVPAGRTAEHLRPAAQLASELGCELLIMHAPHGADPGKFATMAHADWPLLSWHILTMPSDHAHRLLPTTASARSFTRDTWHGALSTKRNMALLVARLCRWKTLFLVDDDIVNIATHRVRAAASRLGRATAMGLAVPSYPDNSVVCHANRLAGGHQEVFVGASALAIDVEQPFGFFPNIYNEDWLFLYDGVAEHLVGTLGTVTQLDYNPFDTGRRAWAQEFGDVIAEGVMGALHEHPHLHPPMDEGYWSAFLRARAEFTAAAMRRLNPRVKMQANARRSLAAADDSRVAITPRRCVDFVRQWRADLLFWREQVERLPQLTGVEQAADYLGLSGRLEELPA
jgi:hypothetical protein